MKEYLITVGGVMTLVSLAGMLLPDGEIKKFASLAAGFMVIAAAMRPVPVNITKFSTEKFPVSEKSIEQAEAQYRAEVISRHRENIKKMTEEHIRCGSEVFVQTDNDGNITEITIRCKGDESEAVNFAITQLGIPRERIKTVYENN